MNDAKKLYQARANYNAAEAAPGSSSMNDQELDEKRHDRSYNPADDAQRGMISAKLNEDAAKYRKGPGPF